MNPLNILAKFEVRSFTRSWDNREYFKNFGSPWIRQRPLFSQIFKGLLFACTLWIYLPNLNFVALHVPEIIGGTGKIWSVPGYVRPHSLFSQIFYGLLLGWTLWIYLSNLKFVALYVPEIIGGILKNWKVPEYANALFSPKFLRGFCSQGPCEYTCQIWSS